MCLGRNTKHCLLQLHASSPSLQYEPDCPGYPPERYTVDIDRVQVANMTVEEFQSRITDHSNGFVTLSLPLTQRLSKKAVTVNMTKFNTVPTNMSDDMGNVVTEMVTWETSAVFGELKVARENGCLEKAAGRYIIELCTIFHYNYVYNNAIYASSADPNQFANPSLHDNTSVGFDGLSKIMLATI